MTTFPEIDIPNAVAEYLKGQGETEIDLAEYYKLVNDTGERSGYPSGASINWIHQSIAKPDDATLISLYDTWKTALDADIAEIEQVTNDAKSLKDFAVLARQFSSEIKTLYLAVMQADFDSDTTAERFETFATIIDGFPNAFKNRFNNAFQAENPTITVVGVSLANLLLFSTANKAIYISFCRRFITVYAQMLAWTVVN